MGIFEERHAGRHRSHSERYYRLRLALLEPEDLSVGAAAAGERIPRLAFRMATAGGGAGLQPLCARTARSEAAGVSVHDVGEGKNQPGRGVAAPGRDAAGMEVRVTGYKLQV